MMNSRFGELCAISLDAAADMDGLLRYVTIQTGYDTSTGYVIHLLATVGGFHIYREVMDKSLVSCFLTHGVVNFLS